ncbi:MAG: phage scaffolding protein [Oscillospiraceae bacterium]|nr:phage scaffolding protein [Oscillospiraceae bacterium]
MTRDELLALGLTDEQAGAVLAAFTGLQAQIDAAKQTEVENASLTARIAALEEEIQLRDKRDAVLMELPAHQPRDVQIILRLIDLSRIGMEEGKITGLNEQLHALRAAAPYLFAGAPDPVGGTAASGMHPTDFDMNTFLRGEN